MNDTERIVELDTINISLKYKLSTRIATIERLEAEIVKLTQERSGYAVTLGSLASRLDEVLRRIKHDKQF